MIGLPSVAEAWFRNPWALVVTHMVTLGFVTAIIMRAMYQFFPVILQTKLGDTHLACYVAGVLTIFGAATKGPGPGWCWCWPTPAFSVWQP